MGNYVWSSCRCIFWRFHWASEDTTACRISPSLISSWSSSSGCTRLCSRDKPPMPLLLLLVLLVLLLVTRWLKLRMSTAWSDGDRDGDWSKNQLHHEDSDSETLKMLPELLLPVSDNGIEAWLFPDNHWNSSCDQ